MQHPLIAIALLLLALTTPAAAAIWTPVDSGVDSLLIDLHFRDGTHGVAVGEDGTVILSSDGGQTWSLPTGTSPTGADLHGVSFGDAEHGIAVGIGGAVWWTADSGQNWTAGVSGTTQNLFEVVMLTSTDGVAVGWGGTILRTTDGGATWSPLPSGTTEPLWGVCMVDAGTLVAAGDYTILRSADSGASWTSIEHPMPMGWFYDVSFADASVGHVVGDFATILRTVDGGLTWTLEHSSDDDAEFFLAVAQKDADHAIAVGWVDSRAHNALSSFDGGQTWSPEPTGYDRSMRSVVYREGVLIASGLGGLLFAGEESPTRIPFVLDRPADISLVVYDVAGRRVKTLLRERRDPGRHAAIWHGVDERGRPVASGVYLYELTIGTQVETRRMTLVK